MAARKANSGNGSAKRLDAVRHKDKRKNIPTAKSRHTILISSGFLRGNPAGNPGYSV